MLPIGPLMIEHRLIERMLAVLRREIAKIEGSGEIDERFLDTAIDFIHTYADRTHHGKEEGILFRALAGKGLKLDDSRLMDELASEHNDARQAVREIVDAQRRQLDGQRDAARTIADRLHELTHFYPAHIAKEDKVFFPASMKYLTPQEQQAMLAAFWEFDRQMIHERYKAVVSALEHEQPGDIANTRTNAERK